ncbi:MAG: hemerythrin family protein [Leptospiraceae bacterium]|nr:hemerythrin family protein [Leptospiraceae bacterium]
MQPSLQIVVEMHILESLPVKLDSVVVDRVSAIWEHTGLRLDLDVIDAQHAWLVALVLELEWTLSHQEGSVPQRFHQIMQEAIRYTETHFKTEEALIKQFGFVEEHSHIKSHRKFNDILAQIYGERKINDWDGAQKLYRYLRKWLLQHIHIEDRKYADFFKRRKLNGQANAYLSEDAPLPDTTALQLRFLKLIQREVTLIEVTTPELLKDITSIWKRLNLATGIPILDIQHLWLIKIIVEVDEAMKESPLTREAVLARTINEAIRYVQVHFRTEEDLMRLLEFDDLENHLKMHRKFEQFVIGRKNELAAGKSRSAATIVHELREWLSSHIALQDRQMVASYRDHKDAVLDFSKNAISSGDADIFQPQISLYRTIVKQGN